ncbi:MAG: P-loop NTPase fold protein [bacterium]
MSYYIGVLIKDLKNEQFHNLVENLSKFNSKIEQVEKHLIICSNDDINAINCLFKLKDTYPEIRYGLSQYIGIARGLTRIAQVGEILFSADLESAIIEHFYITSLGMLTIEGMKTEILVCRVDGPKGEVKFPELKKFLQIIPRITMLDALKNFLNVTKSALIFAPAGTGKTVFIDQFIEEWGKDKEILRTCAVSYLSNITLKPVHNLIMTLFGINFNLGLDEKQKLIERKLKEIGIRDIGTSYLTILDFLGLAEEDTILRKMDPKVRRELTINTICDVLTNLSHLKSVVIIVEDIENLEPSSISFFQEFISKLVDEDVKFIFTSNRAQVNLKGLKEFELVELDRAQVEEYLHNHIGEKISLPPTTILNVAQYLALYKEEQMRYFYNLYKGESPLINFSLSYSDIKTVIKRRVELLTETQKELLYALAMLGFEIEQENLPFLENMGEQIDYFIEHKFLNKIDDKYFFVSPILHEEIYNLIPDKNRHHLRLGDYFRRREGYEEYALFHYLKAENYKKAMEFLLKSTKNAIKKGGFESAINYYNMALDLCRRKKDVADLETLIAINEGLADIYRYLGDEEQAMKYYKVVLDSYKEILKE